MSIYYVYLYLREDGTQSSSYALEETEGDSMKSIDRCNAKFQGDRCRFAKAHLYDGSSENDPMKSFHVGEFTVWDTEGVQQAKAQGAESRPGTRRNRVATRVFRALTNSPEGFQREAVLKDLAQLENFYKRPQ